MILLVKVHGNRRLALSGDITRAAGMGFPDHGLTFIVYAAGAGGIRTQPFINSNLDIGSARGMRRTILRDQVIALYITRAGRSDGGLPRHNTGDMRIRSTALVDIQVIYLDSTFEITGAAH